MPFNVTPTGSIFHTNITKWFSAVRTNCEKKEKKRNLIWEMNIFTIKIYFPYKKIDRLWHSCIYKHFRSWIWCDFDRASSLICGNKMPTRCNRGFYCRSYCLLNTFRAPLCPSSGAQEYYTVVAACGISCCGFKVVGLVWSWGLCVRFARCCILQHNSQLDTRPATWKPQHEIPQRATTV